MCTNLDENGKRKWNGSKWIRREKRLAIYERDNFRCVYCDRDLIAADRIEVTLDHVVAPVLGGTNHHDNLVTACRPCNSAKQHKTLAAFIKYLGGEAKAIRRRVRNALRRKLPKIRRK